MTNKVNIQEDIKQYQDTLSYASSKVDYSMGENIYMLPSDMNLNIKTGTVRYNNKIIVSDEKFSLGQNGKVNADALEPATMESHKNSKAEPTTMVSHKNSAQSTTTQGLAQKQAITHKEERAALNLFLTGGLVYVSMNGSL